MQLGQGKWPLSKLLFHAIINDLVTDRFVCERIWERLGYVCTEKNNELWLATSLTPITWKKNYPVAPPVITQRKASIMLTKSIKTENKQLLKEKLGFNGYKISELYPRRTRRATAVNWLLGWLKDNSIELEENDLMPILLSAPVNPSLGHPGDPLVE